MHRQQLLRWVHISVILNLVPKSMDLCLHELVWGPEMQALSIAQLEEASVIIYGENTYKGMADYWPNAEGTDAKVAPLMNNIAKIVCSQTRKIAEWNNTTIVRDGVSEIQRLKEEEGGPMFVFGSGILSESLMNAGLFDEIRLCVAPTVLGKGRHLFTDTNTQRNFKLLEARPLPSGGVILRYEVVN